MEETITKGINEYGFNFIEVITPEGGRIKVTEYEPVATASSYDIGGITTTNPHGLGGSDYIRSLEDRDNKIASVMRNTWISEKARTELKWFIKNVGEEIKI